MSVPVVIGSLARYREYLGWEERIEAEVCSREEGSRNREIEGISRSKTCTVVRIPPNAASHGDVHAGG